MQGEAEFDEKRNTIALPAIMGWFWRDFGGKGKMIELLHTLQIISADKNPELSSKSMIGVWTSKITGRNNEWVVVRID